MHLRSSQTLALATLLVVSAPGQSPEVPAAGSIQSWFIDASGHVRAYSRDEGILLDWDPATRSWDAPLVMRSPAAVVAYDPGDDRWWGAYTDSTIRLLGEAEEPVIQVASAGAPTNLKVVGGHFAYLASRDLHLIDAGGAQLWQQRVRSSDNSLVWEPATSRLIVGGNNSFTAYQVTPAATSPPFETEGGRSGLGGLVNSPYPGNICFSSGTILDVHHGEFSGRVIGTVVGTAGCGPHLGILRDDGPDAVVDAADPVNGRLSGLSVSIDGEPLFIGTIPGGAVVATAVNDVIRFSLLDGNLNVTHRSAAPPRPVGAFSLSALQPGTASFTWDDASDNESGFRIEARAEGDASWATVGDFAPDTGSGSCGGLISEISYHFRILAISGDHVAETGPIGPYRIPAEGELAGEPYHLRVVHRSASSVTLKWEDHAAEETGFRIIRTDLTAGSQPVTLDLPADTETHTDEPLVPDHLYRYEIQALGDSSSAPRSNPLEVRTREISSYPIPVRQPVATLDTHGRVLLRWVDESPDESAFVVQRSVFPGGSVEIARLPENSTSFIDESAPVGVGFSYRIVTDNGELAYSVQIGPLILPSRLGTLVEENAFEGIRIFAFEAPNRLERFDTGTGAWLESLPLPYPPRGLWVDDDGIFIGQGSEIVRFELTGSESEPLVSVADGPPASIIASSSWIAYRRQESSSEPYRVFDKETGERAPGDTFPGPTIPDFYQPFRTGFPHPKGDGVIGWPQSDELMAFSFESDGGFPENPGFHEHGGRPRFPRLIPSPDGSRFFASSGAVFSTDTLDLTGHLGFSFRDLAFLPDGRLLATRNRMLVLLTSDFQLIGRLLYPDEGVAVASTPGGIVRFSLDPGSGNGLRVTPLAESEFGTPEPVPGPEPEGLEFVPDRFHLTSEGVILMPSRQHGAIFRWSIPEQAWLASIGLSAPPTATALDADRAVLHLLDAGNRLRRLDLDDPALEAIDLLYDPAATRWIASGGERLVTGGEATCLLDLNGRVMDRSRVFTVQREVDDSVWQPDQSRFLLLTDASRLHRVRLSEQDSFLGIGDDSIDGGIPPFLSLRPDGQRLLVAPGAFHSPVSLDPVSELAEPIAVPAWRGDDLFSLSVREEDSVLRRWNSPSYQPEPDLRRIVGEPLSLLPAGDGWVVVTNVLGVPRFTVLDADSAITYISPAPIPAPTDLQVVSRTSTSVTLSWSDRSDTEEGVRVEHRPVGTDSWQPGGSATPDVGAVTVEGLPVDTVHEFRVIAYRSDAESSPSGLATARTLASELEPVGEPFDFRVTRRFSDSVTLEWNDNADNETGFRIIRTTETGSETTYPLGPNTTRFINGRLSPGSRFSYRVQILGAAGPGEHSSEVSVSTPNGDFPPLHPSNLRAVEVGSDSVTLEWGAGVDNKQGFILERTPDINSPQWEEIGRTGYNEKRFADTGLTPDTLYGYRVFSYNAFGESDADVEVVRTLPLSPTYLGISGRGGGRVSFAFSSPEIVRTFDLATRSWLDPLALPAAASHLRPFGSGLLVAADQRVLVFHDGQTDPVDLGQAGSPVRDLVHAGSRIGVVTSAEPDRIQWHDAITGARLGVLVLAESITRLRDDPASDEVIVRLESRWARVVPPQGEGDGTIVMDDSPAVPYTPDFFAPAGGGRGFLIQRDGLVFDPATLSFAGCVGDSIEDVDMDSSGNLVVLRPNSLALLDERPVEVSRYDIPSAVTAMAVEDGQVLLFRPDDTLQDGVAIEIVPGDSFSVPEAGIEVVETAPDSDFSGAFATSDDRLGFLSADGREVRFWSATTRGWHQRWRLPEQAAKVTWSGTENSLLFGTVTRNVRRIDTGDTAAPVVFHPPYSISGLATFDRFVLATHQVASAVAGTSLLHRLDGGPPSTFDLPRIHPSRRDWAAWNPANRRLYLTSTGLKPAYMTLDPSAEVLPPGLVSSSLSAGDRIIRLSSDGLRVAFSSGEITDGDLRLIREFDGEIVDLEWLGEQLVTIRPASGGSRVDRLDDSGSVDRSLVLQGQPLRLFPVSGERLAVVTSWESMVRVHLLDRDFRPVFDSLPQPPSMIRSLHDLRVAFGSQIELDAQVEGSLPLSFQWYRDGNPLPGETSTSLRIPNAGSSSSGSYSVRTTNAHGTTVSNPAIVWVGPVQNPRFLAGSLLVLGDDELVALDSDGVRLPDPMSGEELAPLFASDRIGDLAVDRLGRLHVMNLRREEPAGTWISTWDTDTGRWTHTPHERIATASPVPDSNLEIGGDYLFTNVTRQHLFTGAVEAHGLDSSGGDFTRFSISPEGTMHLLSFPTGWLRVDLDSGRSLGVSSLSIHEGNPESIAFAKNGGAYIAFGNGVIRHLNLNGQVVSQSTSGTSESGDFASYVDLGFNGANRLHATTQDREGFLMDGALGLISEGFTPTTSLELHSTWVPPMSPVGPAISEPHFPAITTDDLAAFQVIGADPDPDSTVAWSLGSVSHPELFRVLQIDRDTGILSYQPALWVSGASDVEIIARNDAGIERSRTLVIEIAGIPLPDPQLAENLVFNPQTGLYEHSLTVTNNAQREIAGFDLAIIGLPAGVEVYNASACEDGTWCVQHRQPLGAGASVTLILEYYAPVRGTAIEPEVAVSLVTEPEDDPAAAAPGLAVDRIEMLDDGLLIEFTAVPGSLYEVQYSDDNATWKVSPTRLRAAGNRVQWIDRGPPRTDSPPADKSSRFYRVRELPENP